MARRVGPDPVVWSCSDLPYGFGGATLRGVCGASGVIGKVGQKDPSISPQQFLQDFNPMFRKGEELLAPYATELPQPEPGHARILLINNSSLPFTEAGRTRSGSCTRP